MMIIPEIEKVVLFVPRTGSGSLRRALAAQYPKAMTIYRHMEADGVPYGYDRWEKVGVVRHPLKRLWSLYKFLGMIKKVAKDPAAATLTGGLTPEYTDRLEKSVQRPFRDWVLYNDTPFTNPYDSTHAPNFFPVFSVRHNLPENRKSQFLYLRPDLGTKIFPYERMGEMYQYLQIPYQPHLNRRNETPTLPYPDLTNEVQAYMDRVFSWDYKALRTLNHALDDRV